MRLKYTKDKQNTLRLRISDYDLALLDLIAADEKKSRSEIIRNLIKKRGVGHEKEIKSEKVAI